MPTVYIFRGKSATGKTTLSNYLSRYLNVAVLRKDDIFDPLSEYVENNATNNQATFDILASQINANIRCGVDIIIDTALPHRDHYMLFLSKIDFRQHRVVTFFCDCSDERMWRARWAERLKAPRPNQYFKDIDDIVAHYAKMNVSLQPGEYYIDSSRSMTELTASLHQVIS